jgi:hypothetical protein
VKKLTIQVTLEIPSNWSICDLFSFLKRQLISTQDEKDSLYIKLDERWVRPQQ